MISKLFVLFLKLSKKFSIKFLLDFKSTTFSMIRQLLLLKGKLSLSSFEKIFSISSEDKTFLK